MTILTEQIAQARDKAEFIPNHYRDEDGVWHDGPYKAEFLAALDQIEQQVAQVEQALHAALRAYEAIDQATRDDAKMGYLLPGESCIYTALALHADETFAGIRAMLSASKEETA